MRSLRGGDEGGEGGLEKKGERDDDQKFGKDAKAHHVVEGPSFTVLNILNVDEGNIILDFIGFIF